MLGFKETQWVFDDAVPPGYKEAMESVEQKPEVRWRDGYQRHYTIIFGAETPLGKLFDVVLLWVIVISVVAVMLETVEHVDDLYHLELQVIEWVVTVLFTVEYFVRLRISRRPLRYALSFFGIVDLLSVIPTYISIFYPDIGALQVIRSLRLIRVFRVLHVEPFQAEAYAFVTVLRACRGKITVFVMTVLIIAVIMGACMYIVEGPEHGYRSIPEGMYWAVVTMATIGYGDLVPRTAVGKILASMLILLGYSLIVVPTGLISAEAVRKAIRGEGQCVECGATGHGIQARYCHRCGVDMQASRSGAKPSPG